MKPSMKDIYSKYVVWDDKNVRGFFGEEYRFLSNFHVCNVWFEGILYPSSEHAYMASKSLSEGVRTRFAKFPSYPFKDPREERSSFAPALTPSEAKKLGQTIE